MSRQVHSVMLSTCLTLSDKTPLEHQLVDQIRNLVLHGRLQPGARLPSGRQLASELAISRNTVVAAYRKLQSRNYIVSQIGVGTFVANARGSSPGQQDAKVTTTAFSTPAPVAVVPEEPGFRIGQAFEIDVPAIDVFPLKAWARLAVNRCSRTLKELLHSADPAGYLPFRTTISEHVRETRGIACWADQVVVSSGQGQAISLAARTLVEPGDIVLIEDPTRLGIRSILRNAGAKLVDVPVDEKGFDLSAVGETAERAKIAIVTPTSHFPLGIKLSAGRRAALGAWARAREGRWIMEDDTGHDLMPNASWSAPLWSLAPGRVIYFSSFRPTIAPSLRLGFMVVPHEILGQILQARLLSDGYRAPLEQAILNDFMVSGLYAQHIRTMQQTYGERHEALSASLWQEMPDRVQAGPSNAGLHTICRLCSPLIDARIEQDLRGKILVRSLSGFYSRPTLANALLLGHSQINPRQIARSVRDLANAVPKAVQ